MCQGLILIELEAYVASMYNPSQMFTPAMCIALPAHHKAAISWITFAPEAKWGITWPKSRAPVFHCSEDPLQAFCLGLPHVFLLNRLFGRREKCLSREQALIFVT